MNDNIVALGPIRFGVNAHFVVAHHLLGLFRSAALEKNGPGHIGPGADALGEYFLLRLVIVAAAAGEQKRTDGLNGPGRAEGCEK